MDDGRLQPAFVYDKYAYPYRSFHNLAARFNPSSNRPSPALSSWSRKRPRVVHVSRLYVFPRSWWVCHARSISSWMGERGKWVSCPSGQYKWGARVGDTGWPVEPSSFGTRGGSSEKMVGEYQHGRKEWTYRRDEEIFPFCRKHEVQPSVYHLTSVSISPLLSSPSR